jgi:Carboxypeptidase regulatory-like domain
MRVRHMAPVAGTILALSLVILVAALSLGVRAPTGALLPRPEDPTSVPPESISRGVESLRPGTSTAEAAAKRVEPGDPDRRETLVGRVVTMEGHPVAGATVHTSELTAGCSSSFATVTTDAHGRYEVEVEAGRMYRITVSGSLPGGVPILQKRNGLLRLPGRTERDVRVEAADVFIGRVLDPAGQPVPGARVEAWTSVRRSRRPYAAVDTGEDGAFRILLPVGGTAKLKAFVPTTDEEGLPYRRTIRSGVKAGEPTDLALTPGAEIRGRVTTTDGQPAPGLPLRAYQALGSHPMVVKARTNAHGEFRIGGLFAMTYTIRIDKARYEGEPGELLGVTVVGAGATDVKLELAAVDLVSGRLYRPGGQAATRRSFWVIHEESGRKITCRTAKDGTFTLRAPKGGTFTAWTRHVANGKKHVLNCGRFTSAEKAIELWIPYP